MKRAKLPPDQAGVGLKSADDSELEEVLKSLRTKITVIGCGGAGSNTAQCIAEEDVPDINIVAANTDAQHLLACRVPKKLLLGRRLTKGLGAGALPKVGEDAAVESEAEIRSIIQGSDLVIVTCGLGGGTGTGSISVAARVAKEMNALTLAVVTLPFRGEGKVRMTNALWGLDKLKKVADTVVVIPNDKLLEFAPRLPVQMAFKLADQVLIQAITGITELITTPGLVNLDFNDLRTIMKDSGIGVVGIGESDAMGEARAEEAVKQAITSPLLDATIEGATGLLVNVSGGASMTLAESEKCIEMIQGKLSHNARVIWGARVDPSFGDQLRVLVIATGVHKEFPVSEPAGIPKVAPAQAAAAPPRPPSVQFRAPMPPPRRM
jgi:cell division protein FtsZ